VNSILIGYAIVVIEATLSSVTFRRPRETWMLASLSRVAAWVALGWAAFRVVDMAIRGQLPHLASKTGVAFLVEIALPVAGAWILLSGSRRAQGMWQVRAAILLLLGGALFRVNTYMIAFRPGGQWSYFPSVPELLITFGIIAAEVAIYVAVVKTFPILSGAAPAAAKR
jgi:Ni/Fe-hydrogenase subunit HybB-like protein